MILFLAFFIVITVSVLVYGAFYVQGRRKEKSAERAQKLQYLLVTIPRKDQPQEKEQSPEKDVKEVIGAAEQLLAGLHSIVKKDMQSFIEGQRFLGFEISATNFSEQQVGQEIKFHVICTPTLRGLVEKQITAFYHDALIQEDPSHTIFTENCQTAGVSLSLNKPFYYPLKTYKNLDADPLSDITNVLGELELDVGAAIQILLQPVTNSWMKRSHQQSKNIRQGKGGVSTNPVIGGMQTLFGALSKSQQNAPQLSSTQEEQMKAMEEKTKKGAFNTIVRVVISAPEKAQAEAELQSILSAFGQFEDQTLNGLSGNYTVNTSDSVVESYIEHNILGGGHPMLLNYEEIASLFHFPHSFYNRTPGIKWLTFKVAPAPASLPQTGILLGYNLYRGKKREVRIQEKDRFRHLYMIGQTGMGKSVLQKFLAKQDIAEGKGVCVVDPHGDLIDDILDWIPPERSEDVIVFDPADTDRPVGLNILEAQTPEEKEFIAQDAMNMMIGLFGNEIFGPRLQDYFRNACLTLMDDEEEGGAITDVVRLFTDDEWQKYKVKKVKNPIVKQFWTKQMAATGAREKEEMIPFWAAKFGAFITNSTMRNIVGQTKSSFNFSDAMDQKKILLVKLAKGLIGDINANLLGMIFVNKIQVAAMRRAGQEKSERVPFFLYVDEFQNFVTDAFESILSEARKYKLGLIIAHQYIGQLVKDNNEKVKNAVFGNVGTMLNFKIGATDAEYMSKEMAPTFTANDLINLEGFHSCLKLNVNNIISVPFSLMTVKDFEEGNKEMAKAVTQLSRLRYGKDRRFVEKEILTRIGNTQKHIEELAPKS